MCTSNCNTTMDIDFHAVYDFAYTIFVWPYGFVSGWDNKTLNCKYMHQSKLLTMYATLSHKANNTIQDKDMELCALPSFLFWEVSFGCMQRWWWSRWSRVALIASTSRTVSSYNTTVYWHSSTHQNVQPLGYYCSNLLPLICNAHIILLLFLLISTSLSHIH